MMALNQHLPLAYGISTFAMNAYGDMVHVSDVLRGLDCKCVCPDCGKRMIARQGKIRSWHFAHYQSVSCDGMTWLHRAAQEILQKEERITVLNPEYALGEITLDFVEVRLEAKLDSRVVDCLCVAKGGHEFIVEMRVTHEVDDDKLADLVSSGSNRDVIEIDLRNYKSRSLDWQSLTTPVCSTSQNVRWLHHPSRQEFETEDEKSDSRAARKAALARLKKLTARIYAMNAVPSDSPRRGSKSRSTKIVSRKRSPKASGTNRRRR